MSLPLSMLQISGRGYPPATLRQSTLLIIDAQEEYRSGVLALPDLDAAVAQIRLLLEAARNMGTPIVHVHHLGVVGGLLDPQGPRGRFLPELTPLPGEVVVDKRLPNAFAGTDLHDRLQASGPDRLRVHDPLQHQHHGPCRQGLRLPLHPGGCRLRHPRHPHARRRCACRPRPAPRGNRRPRRQLCRRGRAGPGTGLKPLVPTGGNDKRPGLGSA